MSTTKSAKGPGLLISIAVLVLGIIVAVAGIIGFATRFVDFLDSPAYTVPGTAQIKLEKGTYLVYDLAPVGLDPSELTVTDPDGRDIRVKSTSPNETITNNSGGNYRSTVEFEVPRPGRYTLRFDTAQRTRVIVQHPLEDIFLDNVGWLLAIVAGGLLGVAGIILLIVGIVRRSKDKRTRAMLPTGGVGAAVMTPAVPGPAVPGPAVVAPVVPAPAAAPTSLPAAAWFPDPHGQHRLRYWDGQAWTDHTSD